MGKCLCEIHNAKKVSCLVTQIVCNIFLPNKGFFNKRFYIKTSAFNSKSYQLSNMKNAVTFKRAVVSFRNTTPSAIWLNLCRCKELRTWMCFLFIEKAKGKARQNNNIFLCVRQCFCCNRQQLAKCKQ